MAGQHQGIDQSDLTRYVLARDIFTIGEIARVRFMVATAKLEGRKRKEQSQPTIKQQSLFPASESGRATGEQASATARNGMAARVARQRGHRQTTLTHFRPTTHSGTSRNRNTPK
jgi:hypothetical protein